MAHVPLFIDLRDRFIVIFGGGHVGERKAKMFCAYGLTKVVSTSFTAELLKMADNGLIDAIEDDLKDVKKYLTGAFIVVPATNNRTLNAFIADQAKAMNILVNQVDGIGEVIVPSVINKDDIRIGISTMGKSPASARFLRLRIEELIENVALMVTLQDELRTILKKEIDSQLERRRILEIIINDQEVWAELARSYDAGLQAALEIVENERMKQQATT
ncbi:MAG: precorrin-2 dehydrogenase/sirohydrochlorin ferrochelatase family protein [Burkholderiales bacterium]